MFRKLANGISERSARVSLLLFFMLLFSSVTFFVMADDSATTKQNIFQDSDQDGLSNDEEALYGTDPMNKDTDGDGYTDGVEVESGYDPLKPAPGDKIVSDKPDTRAGVTSTQATATTADTSKTLTNQISNQIADMVQGSASDGKDISIETISDSVQQITDPTNQEIILPDVNTDDIKIKKLPKKLKGDQKKEQEKQDAVQYLTVMAYILANNSPKSFHSENGLSSLLTSLSMDSISAITSGNKKFLNDLASKGEKTLKEIHDVEVPAGMLDVHIKAIRMAKYSITLKDEMKPDSETDPLGQIASLGKVQGFMGVVADFSQEIVVKLKDYGIDGIPINL